MRYITLEDLQFKLWWMKNFLPVFLLVKWSVDTICLQHLFLPWLKQGEHLPVFLSGVMTGLLFFSLCLHRRFWRFRFFRKARVGFSWNDGASSALMDRMLQLSSMAFLKLGKFLLYVTARMFLADARGSLGLSRSRRSEF